MTELQQLDKTAVRAAFDAAASRYDDAAVLQNEMAKRMDERLDYIQCAPQRILDVGSGTGLGSELLLKRYPKASVLSLDLSESMLAKTQKRGRMFRRPSVVCADAENLPLADESIDLLWSNATLQWCDDLNQTFAGFRRVMRSGGLLMFTTFGPDTLYELREAFAQVDQAPHVNAFLDMHDVGDALMSSGFAQPVMDMEKIILTYEDVLGVMRDLKAIGVTNAHASRRRGLMGRQRLRALSAAYEVFKDGEGRLPTTYEVVYGHAWVPDAPAPSAATSSFPYPVNPAA